MLFFCKITKQCFLVKTKCLVSNYRITYLCKNGSKLHHTQHIIMYEIIYWKSLGSICRPRTPQGPSSDGTLSVRCETEEPAVRSVSVSLPINQFPVNGDC